MPATEPAHVTDAERDDPNNRPGYRTATITKGGWRTLIQQFDGSEWVTMNEYPGDWALQWEHVARDERQRNARYRQVMDQAIRKLNDASTTII